MADRRTGLWIFGGAMGVMLLIGGVALLFVVGVLAAIAIPNFLHYQALAKRSEVPANVEGIRTGQILHEAGYGSLVAVGNREEAMAQLTTEPHPWIGNAEWRSIGFEPESVRGAYWVAVQGDYFEVHGIIDADGDGIVCEYVATRDAAAAAVTAGDVY